MFKLNSKNYSKFATEDSAWKDLQKGNLDALGFFYDKYIDDLFSVGMYISSDREQVQDAIHDMFLEVYKYHEKLSDVDNHKSYFTIAFRRKLFKKTKKKEVYLSHNELEDRLNVQGGNQSEESKIIEMEQESFSHRRVKHALESLTPHQIKVLDLKFSENKTYDEIAVDLNVSINSARTLVYRTLKELRKTVSIFL